MAEPFLSFSKAYLRYMHGYKPVNGTGPRLVALRALEAALRETGGDSNPVRSDIHVFNRAAQMVVDKYSPAAAYRHGGQLEMISEFLCDNKLAAASVRWRNFIKRPSDSVRVGKEFDERRNEKMPTQAALDALPEIFLRAVKPVDVIVSSVAALPVSYTHLDVYKRQSLYDPRCAKARFSFCIIGRWGTFVDSVCKQGIQSSS